MVLHNVTKALINDMKTIINWLFLTVLMEKLLRTCDVESIYILIRNKKNDDIHTRIGKIFDDPVSTFLLLTTVDFNLLTVNSDSSELSTLFLNFINSLTS